MINGGLDTSSLSVDEQLKWEIDQISEQIDALRVGDDEPKSVLHKAFSSCQVQEEEEKWIVNQLKALEDMPCFLLPNDKDWLQSHILDDVKENNSLLQEIHAVVKSQRKSVQKSLTQISAAYELHVNVQEAASVKVAAFQNSELEREQIQSLSEMVNTSRKFRKEIMSSLKDFTETHFPELTPQQTAPAATRRKGKVKVIPAGLPLEQFQSTLLDLMNQRIEQPNNPYIDLRKKNVWQPYVELLIREVIAVRHRTNCNLIKLLPFDSD